MFFSPSNPSTKLFKVWAVAQNLRMTTALSDFMNESPDMTIDEIIDDFCSHYDIDLESESKKLDEEYE